jgi:hypothetical protein
MSSPGPTSHFLDSRVAQGLLYVDTSSSVVLSWLRQDRPCVALCSVKASKRIRERSLVRNLLDRGSPRP